MKMKGETVPGRGHRFRGPEVGMSLASWKYKTDMARGGKGRMEGIRSEGLAGLRGSLISSWDFILSEMWKDWRVFSRGAQSDLEGSPWIGGGCQN